MKKQTIAAVLAAGCIGLTLPALSLPVSAEIIGSGECGENLTWTLDDSDTLTISGEGEMWDYCGYYDDATGEYIEGEHPDVPWRSLVMDMLYDADRNETGIELRIIIEDGVTSIGRFAFSDLGEPQISMPESILLIGEEAFSHCHSIIELPANIVEIGDYAFWDCANEEIIFPDSLQSIGLWGFRDCENLKSVTLPASLQSIGEEAFYGCNNLKSVTILNPNCAFPTWTDEETGETGYNIVFMRLEFEEYAYGVATRDIFDGTIYGYTNSTAQAYVEYMIANEHGYSNASFIALDAAEPETTAQVTTTTTPAPAPATGDSGIALALAGLLAASGAAVCLRKKD